MSQFNRKGFTTVRYRDDKGATHIGAIHKNSKIARQAARRIKQMKRQHKAHVNEYKDRLRQAKKSVPLEQRSKVNWSEELS